MPKRMFLIGIILLAVVILVVIIFVSENENSSDSSSHSKAMQITSSEFKHNQTIPSKYTCDGENTSPPLQISGVPENAQSLVLIMDDPDAPAGTWVHWLIWNINPSTQEIQANQIPSSSQQGTSSFGVAKYGGPCPPSGTHRYFFKLYALDQSLELPPSTDKSTLLKAMQNHILDQTEMIGLYSRLGKK